MRRFIVLLMALALPALVFAQTGTIVGNVTQAGTDNPLASAQVQIAGTTLGSATDLAGDYVIFNVPAGTHTIKCTFLGYKAGMQEVTVEAGATVTVDFALSEGFIAQKELTFFASRATERLTPVAFTDVEKTQIQERLGSRDLPMILNTTPSVYATETGGGPGDSRINIRGFNQRNVAVMINGVPVNDMENGWVYWSNWDGLADVTSSIQVQRGLSSSNMAVTSVGGAMNVITDAAAMDQGAQSKTEVGAGGFMKETVSFSTGLLNEKFALSASGVRKVAEGQIDKTWTDAWAYFLGASFIASENHKIDFHFFGAPQRHGQRTYSQKVGVWSYDLAESIGYGASFDPADERGYLWNPHWGPVSSEYMNYANTEYYNGAEHDVKQDDFLMERENYYHKPQGNINWYWKINDRMNLTTVAYLSLGLGGGTGTYGYGSKVTNDDGTINFDQIIQNNMAADQEAGDDILILRNSVNDHTWYGAISKFDYQMNENLKTQFGVDWRYFEGRHFREVRNLLGADYYLDGDVQKGLGDKIAYHFNNYVNWLGVFGQGEYVMGDLSIVAMAGLTSVGYRHENYYGSLDGTVLEPDAILGYQAKGGANYNINDAFNVYGNFGYNSKPPIFDGVIDDGSGTFDTDPTNEKIINFEVGTGYIGMERKLNMDGNIYYTMWNDRTWNSYYTDPITEEDYIYTLEGLDQVHMGFEYTANYRPINMLELNLMASIGNWEYANDVHATYRPDSNPQDVQEVDLYIAGLKVGDAAQTTFALGGTVFPIKGAYLNATWKFFDRYYSDFDPTGRTDDTDTEQAWETPNYYLLDLHMGYSIANPWNLGMRIGADIFNVLDAEYISDASDGSSHTGSDAYVYVGTPMRWVVNFTLTY